MRYLSVCSGIEAASVAFEGLGWECAGVSEVDPFACAVLAHRYPNVKNFGDFTKIEKEDVGEIDLLIGGTPCFSAGTLIALERGLVRIEDVKVGDRALTHEGRYQNVSAVGSKMAPTIRVKGQAVDVITTEAHRFFGRRSESHTKRFDGKSVRVKTIHGTEWIAAKELHGVHVATPVRFPRTSAPKIAALGRESNVPFWDERLAWIVGAWLGDGWTRMNSSGTKGNVLICAARGPQSILLGERLRDVFERISSSKERTTDRYVISSRALVRWLRAEFGSGAYGKVVPTWLLGQPRAIRSAFLAGYLFADGCSTINGRKLTTVSPGIALGIAMLSHSLGFSTSTTLSSMPATTIIEGRTVNQRNFYTVNIYDRARSSYQIGIHRFGIVKSVTPTGKMETVYDLTVEEDHSYVAAGSVVHNCQDFSVAGLRAGLEGDRGQLTIEFLHLANRLRPRWVAWENVPGVLSADAGVAFGTFLGRLGECGYGWAYRVLDAQYFGVPQRRRRVFVIGYLGDWRRAAAILFNGGSLSGNPTPSRQTGEIATALTANGAGGGGGPDDNEAQGNHLIADRNCGDGSDGKGGSGKRSGDDGVAETLAAYAGRNQIEQTYVAQPMAFETNVENEVGIDVSPTIDTRSADGPRRNQGGVVIAFSSKNAGGDAGDDHVDASPNGGGQVAIAFAVRGREDGAVPEMHDDGQTVGTIRASDGGSSQDFLAFDTTQVTSDKNYSNPQPGDPCHPLAAGADAPAISAKTSSAVRRLTPEECEKLQGFLPGWTLVPYRNGKLAADGNRYRALGNSFAVPVVSWIGRRIQMVEDLGIGE